MATVSEHYAHHLAPIYVWMAGGLQAAIATGREDVASLVPSSGLAIDLGAGFGMHSIPLAQGGYRVLAIDQSGMLLDILRSQGTNLSIRCAQDNLLNFRSLMDEETDVILCMGDTLTHLENPEQVEWLLEEISRALSSHGRFVATFRDYSVAANDVQRFIPVRSDANRILTCFLEEHPEHILVHDIIHERQADSWHLRVSSYPKLRLVPADLAETLRKHALRVRIGKGPRGLVQLEASKRG